MKAMIILDWGYLYRSTKHCRGRKQSYSSALPPAIWSLEAAECGGGARFGELPTVIQRCCTDRRSIFGQNMGFFAEGVVVAWLTVCFAGWTLVSP